MLLETYQQTLLRQVERITTKGYLTTLKIAFNRAVRHGWLPENPARLIPKVLVPRKIARFLIKSEVRKLLRAARNHPLFGLVATYFYIRVQTQEGEA